MQRFTAMNGAAEIHEQLGPLFRLGSFDDSHPLGSGVLVAFDLSGNRESKKKMEKEPWEASPFGTTSPLPRKGTREPSLALFFKPP